MFKFSHTINEMLMYQNLSERMLEFEEKRKNAQKPPPFTFIAQAISADTLSDSYLSYACEFYQPPEKGSYLQVTKWSMNEAAKKFRIEKYNVLFGGLDSTICHASYKYWDKQKWVSTPIGMSALPVRIDE